MKQATKAIRCVDKLGRVVIPMYVRKICDLEPGTEIEILLQGKDLILRKYVPEQTCIFCNSQTNLEDFHGKLVCKDCMELIKNL